jgi:hypothetical protein
MNNDRTVFVFREPGCIPRVGYPGADVEASLREWMSGHPLAQFTVVHIRRGNVTWVDDGKEFLAIRDALRDYVPPDDEDENDE